MKNQSVDIVQCLTLIVKYSLPSGTILNGLLDGDRKLILKRIEAYGFKSFADKIEFKFEHAITAIVGPNGSGKSNVADALRWVLGEQNVRNLRGAKMEDLIFNGSSSRKAVNIADVSLILDNSARIFPIEFNEVAITRRMYRSGESEYYINKTACRLKDIYELLSGTGIGKDSMSIIGQNKADEILNYKPEERRVIFEEAAGIGKYKTRKKEAERKLADTDANITRIDDITEETSCNLDALAQSATRTTRHNEASRQLCGLRLDSLALRLDKLNAAKTHCKEQEQLLNDEIIKSDTNINLMEITQLEANTSLNELNDAMSRIEAGINELNISAQTITGKVELENSHIDAASRRVQAIDEEITRLNLEIQAVSEERINNQTAIENVREQQESAQNKLNKTIAELDVVKREVSDAEQRIAAIRNDAFQKVQQTSHVKNELRACVMERENIRKSRSRFTEDSQQMQRELAKERALYEQCKAACMASNLEVHALSEQLSKLDAGVAEGKSKLEQYNTLHNRIVSNTQRMQVRLNSLMHLAQTHEGFSRATKAVLAGTFHWNRAVYGAIGELIDTEEYYALAIETALGSAAQNIVCKDDETARLAIAYLKEAKIGRVTFLPLANLRNTRYQTSTGLPDGIIGRASELVTYDKAYEQAVEMLLGRILIARDYDTARRAARELNYSSRIVTLEGEVIAPGGAITGGSNHRTGTGVVTRNAEIAALENDLNEFAEKMHNNEIAINNEQHALHNLVQQQTQSLNMHNAKKVHLSECQYLYTQSEQKVAALANACQLGEQEAAQIEQSDEEKTEQIIALEAKLKECEREEHGLQQLIEQRTIEYDQRKSGAEHMRERYNSDYIEYNDLKSKLDSAHEKLRIINKNELYYTQALDRNNREVSEQQAQIYKARQSISNLNAELRDIKQRRSEKSISLQNNFYEKNVLLEKLALLDKDL